MRSRAVAARAEDERMKVLVTGGTGNVGKEAVSRLVANGWEVRVVGRRGGMEIPGAEYAVCDVTCCDDVREKLQKLL